MGLRSGFLKVDRLRIAPKRGFVTEALQSFERQTVLCTASVSNHSAGVVKSDVCTQG